MKKVILIVYFSRDGDNYLDGKIVHLSVGNTQIAAEKIQMSVGGDIFKIIPLKEYPEDYHACVKEASAEFRSNARPELVEYPDRIDNYDTVILAYPNWCGSMPMPVWTFLEKYDFTGKTILPLCTNEGSGMGKSEANIKKLCPTASVKKGLSIKGGSVQGADDIIAAWLKTELL